MVRQMSQVYVTGLACVRQMSQAYVTGLACGASDVTGLCHRFGMWCVRCHRFMSQVWHVVRQMSQVYVTGLACGASDVTGLCHRFGMCASDITGLACVMASVRQMSCHVICIAL